MSFSQIILMPFVWLLTFFYNLVGSYGIALILFAVVVKLILFPFSLKGKRSMIQMNMLNGQLQKLQKQYGKDRERYNMEVQKLYEREHVNPMGGCLWSFLPLLILLPLYAIIRRPLFYSMGLTVEQIAQVAQTLNWSTVAQEMGWIKSAAEFTSGGYNELFLASLINESNLPAIQAVLGEGSRVFAMNFHFLGLDLSQVPQLKFWVAGGFGLFLLPVISAGTGLLFSLISMKTNSVNSSSDAASNPTSKTMLIITPLMSLWIGFAMPAALCLYWITNNVLSMLQEFVCGKLLKKDYERAAIAKAEQERLEKEEEKERRRKAAEDRARRLEEEKLNKGKKKKGEKKKDEEDGKIPGAVKEASRVGMRQYARGRAYDPNRYGGPTPYQETGGPAPELEPVPVEEALPQEVTAAEPAPEQEAQAAEERVTPPPDLETPVYDTPDYDAGEAEAPYAEESEADGEPEKKE